MIAQDVQYYIDLYGEERILHVLSRIDLSTIDDARYCIIPVPSQVNEDWDLPTAPLLSWEQTPLHEVPDLDIPFEDAEEIAAQAEIDASLTEVDEAITLLCELLPRDRTFASGLEAPITQDQALRQWNRIKNAVPVLLEDGEGWIDIHSALEVAMMYRELLKQHLRAFFIEQRERCCAILRREMTKARRKDQARRFEAIRRLTTKLKSKLKPDRPWPTWAGKASETVTDPRVLRIKPVSTRWVDDDLSHRYYVIHHWETHKEMMLAAEDFAMRDPENLTIATDVTIVELFPFYRFFPKPREREREPADLKKNEPKPRRIKWPEGHPKRKKQDREMDRVRRRRAEQAERDRIELPTDPPISTPMIDSPLFPVTVPEGFVPWVKELDNDQA
jgi:hypothetical protein